MKRRDFLLLAGFMSVSWTPAAAEVEIPRIGLIHAGSRQENQGLVGAFQDGLSALGWTDGNNIAVVDRWAEERTEGLPAIVKELIGFGVAVLVTAGTPATLAAKRATATIPIVLVAVDDPVSIGVVESLGKPGGNATGLSLTSSEVITERLELLRELVPGLHRLAVIVRHDPGLDQKLQDIHSEAQRNAPAGPMPPASTVVTHSSTDGAAPSSIETGLGARGAACADATKARPTADARIKARIAVSRKKPTRQFSGMAANKS
jgi:putative ABC transport system substrate-binding protein